MWRNYLVIGFRELRKNAVHTLISIAGLAVGLGACLLIFAHIAYERGFDAWMPDAERLYSFTARADIQRSPDHVIVYGTAPYAAVRVFPEQVPGVEAGAVMAKANQLILKDGTAQNFNLLAVTPAFLDFFPLSAIAGEPRRALAEPDTAVLTASAAEHLFGRRDVLGRMLETAGGERYKVDAVVGDLPEQTHFEGDILLAYQRDPDTPLWEQSGLQQVYLRLAPEADTEAVRQRIETIIDKNMAPPDFFGKSVSADYTALLCPVRTLHFTRGLCNMLGKPAADPDRLWVFAAIGAVILLLGTINFANITAARSIGRIREVAMRKALGASRSQIAGQFLGESALVALAALAIGVALAVMVQPLYADMIGRGGSLAAFAEAETILGILLLALLAGAAGGLYPAYLSLRLPPGAIFSADTTPKARPGLRTGLIGIQFVAGVALGAAALIAHQQFRHLLSADLGFDPRNVVIVDGNHDDGESVRTMFPALAQETSFESVALASGGPAMQGMRISPMAGAQGEAAEAMEILYATADYFDVFGIGLRLAPGVDDLAQRWRDGRVIVNEKAAKRLGFANPEAALGAVVYRGEAEAESTPLEIIGITPDMYLHTIESTPQPVIFHPASSDAQTRYIIGRIAGGRSAEALAVIDRLWRERNPVVPVSRYFASDRLAVAYFESLRRNRFAFALATGIAVAIAVLGLFGLAALAAERRTHEVAIRKVLGAQTPAILRLVLLQFLRPVFAAIVAGWVLAYYFMHDWLEGFGPRIELTAWPFLLAGAAALAIALLTVSSHALRVARTHPALALREE